MWMFTDPLKRHPKAWVVELDGAHIRRFGPQERDLVERAPVGEWAGHCCTSAAQDVGDSTAVEGGAARLPQPFTDATPIA